MRTVASRIVPVVMIVIVSVAAPAYATHTAGERVIPAPLITDDPDVEGEASIHPVTVYRNSTADSPDITTAYGASGEGDRVKEGAMAMLPLRT